MQSLLRNNRETLLNNGVRVIDLWEKFDGHAKFRNVVSNATWQDNPTDEDVAGLREILSERLLISKKHDQQVIDTYVISFENLIGSYHLSNTNGIYPNAARAARIVSESFSQLPVKAFFSIRSFDRFIESCYLRTVYTQKEHRTFKRFYRDVCRNTLS